MFRTINIGIIRYIAITLILLVIAEMILRIVGYPSSYTDIYKFDKEIGYSLAPGEHIVFIGNDKRSVVVSDDGVLDRGGDKKAEVILLGDGVIAGLELAKEKRLAVQLSKIVNFGVVNLSVPGYGTVQQWLALRQWIDLNGPPKHVFIIYNLSNDYYDNVPEWESKRIPGIRKSVDRGYEALRPKIPSMLGQKLRYIAWNSRLFSFSSQLMRVNKVKEELTDQQKWLYLESPPNESTIGHNSTKAAAAEIQSLGDKHGFTVSWLVWRDLALEFSEEVSGVSAVSNVKQLIKNTDMFIDLQRQENTGLSFNPAAWEHKWLYPQTRHASASAVKYVSFEISRILNDYREQ